MKKLLLQIFLIVLMLNPLSAICIESKSLYLQKDSLYLLLFDEKIEEFEASKEGVVDIKLMTTIYNDKHQVILKPTKSEDINIILWSKNDVFNFDVFVDKETISEKIISISSAQKKEIENLSEEAGVEIDLPPDIKTSFEGFKIDTPPRIEEAK